nr:hypothetical protein [uncultured Pseudomonas sp.]
MSEQTTRLYIKHPDQEIQKKLYTIFKTINDEQKPSGEETEKDLLACALEISPANANKAYSQLLKNICDAFGKPSDDLIAEAKGATAGYNTFRFVHGSVGLDVIRSILEFLFELSPEIDARACLRGDDEPCEFFFKIDNGKVLDQYYEPDDGYEDEGEMPHAYIWWHEGLPEEINEGLLYSASE